MATIAILQCGENIQPHLASASRNSSYRSFSFPYESKPWQRRRWLLGVFLAPSSLNSAPAVVAVGAVRPGNRYTTREIAVTVEQFHLVKPEITVQTLRRRLKEPQDSIDREGLLTESAGQRLLMTLVAIQPELQQVLDELAGSLDVVVPPGAAADQWTLEKDQLGTLLQITRFDRGVLRSWRPSPPAAPPFAVPFLVGLPERRVYENVMIEHDAKRFPGWFGMDAADIGWRVFRRRGQSLFVANVNQQPPERILGADLVYFHEQEGAFVFVQYKRMVCESGNSGWGYRPDDYLIKELGRMKLLDEACEEDEGSDFRLVSAPSWVKLCEPQPIAVNSVELLKGMYFTRDQLERLMRDKNTHGKYDGIWLTKDNVNRYLNNTMFTSLVGDGWIGSRRTGRDRIAKQIRDSLDAHHSLTIGVHSA